MGIDLNLIIELYDSDEKFYKYHRYMDGFDRCSDLFWYLAETEKGFPSDDKSDKRTYDALNDFCSGCITGETCFYTGQLQSEVTKWNKMNLIENGFKYQGFENLFDELKSLPQKYRLLIWFDI